MKPTDAQYREVVTYLAGLAWSGVEIREPHLSPDPHGQIQRVQDGGAFVECFVFVPDALVEKLEANKP